MKEECIYYNTTPKQCSGIGCDSCQHTRIMFLEKAITIAVDGLVTIKTFGGKAAKHARQILFLLENMK